MADTLTKPEIDKEEAFSTWLEALRSGEYEQGKGALCKLKLDEGGKLYCCVGVLDETVFNTTWTPWTEDSRTLQDDSGYTHNLSSESPKAQALGLHKKLTEEEVSLLLGYMPAISTEDSRLAALAQLNDEGVDFDTIAMIIEDELEWSKDD